MSLSMTESLNSTHGCMLVPPRIAAIDLQPTQWFAIQTCPRHEKKVVVHLTEKGIANYLPLMSTIHQWCDRRKRIEVPVFPGYVFVRLASARDRKLDILSTPGVVRFLGIRNEAVAIPEKQIADIQQVLDSGTNCTMSTSIPIGKRVRIRGGCLDRVEGILTQEHGRTLVICVDLFKRSMAVRVTDYELEAA